LKLFSWHSPPAKVVLGNEDVHIWYVDLREIQRIEDLKKVLAPDELIKAGRRHFKKDRDRYIVTRGILRIMIGDYLSADPCQLQFSYSAYGKPTLGDSPLHFNLSHSNDVTLYAFTRNRDIGIDVEKIRTDLNTQEITERFFTPKENGFINALPNDKRYEAFFSFWTRKEAYIKGKGQGMSISLDSFDVSGISRNSSSETLNGWSLTELNPASGYIANLAVEDFDWRLSCWKWKFNLTIPL